MSDEDFLQRWSRRKQEAQRVAEPPPVAKAEPAAQDPAAGEAATAPQPAFDPASLPPIDSITAASDISAFLRAGVPAELTRAALRRVWTADPAIRDFVGLSENAWDFTNPNAMAGFGPLELTADVRAMITRAVQQIGTAAQPRPLDAPSEEPNVKDSSALKPEPDAADAPQPAIDEVRRANEQASLQSNEEPAVVQHDLRRGDQEQNRLPRRGHGGALPR